MAIVLSDVLGGAVAVSSTSMVCGKDAGEEGLRARGEIDMLTGDPSSRDSDRNYGSDLSRGTGEWGEGGRCGGWRS